MADRNLVSPIAPLDGFPERVGTTYEGKMAPNTPGKRGPLRFEENLASDTDIPNEFTKGISQGYVTDRGHNANVYEKWPEETMRERAHVGSAAWVEAPTYLGEFAHGVNTELAEHKYEQVNRSAPFGRRYERHNPAEVMD